MNLSNDHRDLLELLDETRRRVPDTGSVWCGAAIGFETTAFQRKGIVLGGAWSPQFLRDLRDPRSEAWITEAGFVPWTVGLRNPRVALIRRATQPLEEWLGLLEAVALAKESLLLIADEISPKLLETLIVNSLKGVLPCCAVRLDERRNPDRAACLGEQWSFLEKPPEKAQRLPQVLLAWIRRTATVLFPESEEAWLSGLDDLTVISVGGENYDDQQDRLRVLLRAIEESDR
jgi:hypothetical protein